MLVRMGNQKDCVGGNALDWLLETRVKVTAS